MSVYTCTMNLAIDMFIQTEDMEDKKVNRTIYDELQANGKGVNVSIILKKLGIDSIPLGFKAGFTGDFIEDELKKQAIWSNFVKVDGTTRINVFTQVMSKNQEFKLVNQPIILEESQGELLKQFESLNQDDFLIVSGSLPRGISSEIFLKIGQVCQKRGINLIYDISDSILIECLAFKPYLIKPNDEEISEWFQLEKPSLNDLVEKGKLLQERGAKNVLISLGGEGCLLLSDSVYFANAPSGIVVNTACAGDTLLGTFLANKLKGHSEVECLAQAVAAGSSTAFRPGLTDFTDVELLRKQIKIKEITDGL
uniref:1-phosphofructokinase n=1 Tax=Streptococcus pluranimalium TaxID=82348 RepID=UPI003F690243